MSECTTDSGSAPPTGPTVTSQAVSQQVSQTVPACRREGPERMEQAVHQPAVHQALMGGVGVAQDGFGPALID